ncbi:hypothetical protein G3RUM_00394 [Candidatus Nanosyncoccus alces]|uniref:Uncharacterized protein n=1 Tax=Candidatus Nanosyncoccus alces TaxID=2171997 RepID=A0ABY0FPR1_9BACT|nr:hypothetical protein G3RUM_00394 [Candidatus Nanosyncoccus alces]
MEELELDYVIIKLKKKSPRNVTTEEKSQPRIDSTIRDRESQPCFLTRLYHII